MMIEIWLTPRLDDPSDGLIVICSITLNHYPRQHLFTIGLFLSINIPRHVTLWAKC